MPLTPIQKKMWLTALTLAAGIFVVLLVYVYLYNHTLSLLAISQAVAGTAGFMIGISFLLGPLAYYYKKLSPRVAYRKYIGLAGFCLALAYSLLLITVDPNRYWYNLPGNLGSVDIVLGVMAMSILTFMAVISNTWGIKTLGPGKWRWGLRLGYIAYALLIIRGIVLEWDMWTGWWQNMASVPPPRLVLSVFAGGVIVFRVVVATQKSLRRRQVPRDIT